MIYLLEQAIVVNFVFRLFPFIISNKGWVPSANPLGVCGQPRIRDVPPFLFSQNLWQIYMMMCIFLAYTF